MNSSTNIHALAYQVTLALLAASLPLSKFTMSVFEFVLLGLWLWSGFSFNVCYRFFKLGGFFKGFIEFIGYIFKLAYHNLVDKFKIFFRNKPAMVFSLVYLIHVLGLLHTADFDYAFKDLRVKLPLILLPVVISTMPGVNYRQIRNILVVYTLAVFVSTLVSSYILLSGSYMDIREISPFISPIRLGLNVSFAFFIMIYFVFHDRKFKIWRSLFLGIGAIWFLVFLFLLESITSITIVLLLGIGYLLIRLYLSINLWQRIVMFLVVVLTPTLFIWHIKNIVDEATTAPEIDFTTLEVTTPYGNKYVHDTVNKQIEDGKYVGLYICYLELVEEWNKRSDFDYDGKTAGGSDLSTTLIRYLSSKDLRKDKDGVNALTSDDIYYIEQGLANYNYVYKPGLKTRVLKILKGYEVFHLTGNPSGSSVMQRWAYIKASLNVIKENIIFGVGTGDLENALNVEFDDMESGLEDRYKYHAHNQFLGIFISTGLIGFIIFIFGIFYPAIKLEGFKDYFFTVFFSIMIISMFSDDTLETQAGVTLFAFFYVFFLFGRKKGDNFPADIKD